MKTLFEIVEMTLNNEKPNYDELRYALLVYRLLYNNEHNKYRNVLLGSQKLPFKTRTYLAQKSVDFLTEAMKTDPKFFCGEEYDPENPVFQEKREVERQIIQNLSKRGFIDK